MDLALNLIAAGSLGGFAVLEPPLDPAPEGFAYVVNSEGAYYRNAAGNYWITELA